MEVIHIFISAWSLAKFGPRCYRVSTTKSIEWCIWNHLSINLGWDHIMINTSIWFEVFTKLMKFVVYYIFLLFNIIFNYVLLLLKWKWNVDKLIHIVFIDCLCFEKFNSWNPLVPFVLICTSKFYCSCVWFSNTFPCILCHRYIKIIGRWLHHGLWYLEYILDFDNSKCLFIWLILLNTMKPRNIPRC